MLNNNGTDFLNPLIFFVGTFPVGIVAGRFVGRAFDDLAVANQADNSISILRGNGRGASLTTRWSR